jgi:hypothetical protein
MTLWEDVGRARLQVAVRGVTDAGSMDISTGIARKRNRHTRDSKRTPHAQGALFGVVVEDVVVVLWDVVVERLLECPRRGLEEWPRPVLVVVVRLLECPRLDLVVVEVVVRLFVVEVVDVVDRCTKHGVQEGPLSTTNPFHRLSIPAQAS